MHLELVPLIAQLLLEIPNLSVDSVDLVLIQSQLISESSDLVGQILLFDFEGTEFVGAVSDSLHHLQELVPELMQLQLLLLEGLIGVNQIVDVLLQLSRVRIL